MTKIGAWFSNLARSVVKRISSIDYLPGFDSEFYLSNNPDVLKSRVDALSHYRRHGWRERRRPSKYFDPEAYLALNPDVDAAQIDPLQHFVDFGILEGRKGWDGLPGFDRNYYLSLCPESRPNPVKHYLEVGWRLGLRPNREFDLQRYLDDPLLIIDPDICPYIQVVYNSGFMSSRPRYDPTEAGETHLTGMRRFSDFIRRAKGGC